MPFKNDGLSVQEYVYDFSVDGGAASAVTLSDKAGYDAIPIGSIILGVHAKVVTTVTSGGSATVEWGNGGDADGFSGTAIAKATLVANYVVNHSMNAAALLWDNTNDNDVPYYVADAASGAFKMIANVAALTAGKIVFMVTYLKPSL